MKRSILHHLFSKVYNFFSFVLGLSVCYAMHVTPAFSQGTLVAKKLGTTASPYGYYEYLPTTYHQKSKHPVIIFLSGIGEKGNGTTDLDKVLKHGPPKLIKNGSWPSSRPFIVFAPQSSNSFLTPDELRNFITYITKTYKVDPARIYLTGLSAGGVTIWKYLKRYQDQIAAAIPISGDGRSPATKACDFKHIPIWAFHGSNDDRVNMSESIYPVEQINACSPKPNPLAKVTIYPGVGHDAWTRTYDLSGMNSKTDSRYNPYNISIYDWMLLYSRDGSAPPAPTNQPPVANAGKDISVSKSTTKVVLDGSGSHDSDGKIVSYTWKKISGPSASLSGASSSKLSITNLSVGTYTFKLIVKDDDGASGNDKVTVTVNSSTSPPPSASKNGLNYYYYEGNWSKLPDFSKLKTVKTGQIANFDLSPRNRNDKFGFRFEGFIHITTAGQYTFYTTSDDGSALYINNKVVVSNDGLHGSREHSGKITLSVGYHAIKVKYFEKTGRETLSVKYAGPGIGKQNIPQNKLFISNGSNVKVATNARVETAADNASFEKPVSGEPQIISVYPNPVEDKIHIRLTPGEIGEISCKLLNYTGVGHEVSVENAKYTDGDFVIDVSRWNLSAGIYLLQVTYNQTQQVFRIIKK